MRNEEVKLIIRLKEEGVNKRSSLFREINISYNGNKRYFKEVFIMLITKMIMDKLSESSEKYLEDGTNSGYVKSTAIMSLAVFLDSLWISWTVVVIWTWISKLISLFKKD